jgi:hypothetical protein
MRTTGSHQKTRKDKEFIDSEAERRNQERRREQGEGYTYIPIVGWYCRRSKLRRDRETDN